MSLSDDYVFPGPRVSNPPTKYRWTPWSMYPPVDGPHEKWCEQMKSLTPEQHERWRERYDNYAWAIEQENKKDPERRAGIAAFNARQAE